MKIWPFDHAAIASDGYYISGPDLDRALEPFRKIRRCGRRPQWTSWWSCIRSGGTRLRSEDRGRSRAFRPLLVRGPDSGGQPRGPSRDYAAKTRVPICGERETLGGKWEFRDLLETGACGIVMPDLSWCGGLTEARKNRSPLADTYHRPVAPARLLRVPVAFMACVHLSLSVPNALVQESVRSFYSGWYRELVTATPVIDNGWILPPEGPGLGTELLPISTAARTRTSR